MAFEQVTVRCRNGQEYGPVSMLELQQWHRDGRIPLDAVLVDSLTSETRPASSFPMLAVPPPPSMVTATSATPPTSTDHLIPIKNSNALIAYYCAVFGLVCGILLGPVALVLGIKGFRAAKTLGVGRTHALVGIIAGSIETVVGIIVTILLVIGIVLSHK